MFQFSNTNSACTELLFIFEKSVRSTFEYTFLCMHSISQVQVNFKLAWSVVRTIDSDLNKLPASI